MGDNESVGPNNIPEELVSEILCYLPVKSLIRFTVVSKSWFRLIRNDHHFAMKNYLIRTTSSSKVLDNVDYMFSNIGKSGNPCLYSFTKAKSFRFSTKFECVPDLSIRVSNSCHGIICFHFLGSEEILCCNPLIQEAVLLPPCPTKKTYNGIKALGFDPIQNDYKVVAIDFPSTNNYLYTVNLYSLRHRHWRNLYVSTPPRCTYRLKDEGGSNANGRIYNWLFYKEVELRNIELTLLSFDMEEEVLKEFPLPKCEDSHYCDLLLLSSTRWQACLSCLHRSRNSIGGFIHVWVLKDWIWTKAIVVNFPDYEPMEPSHLWINDNELFVKVPKGNITEVFHYDLVTRQFKRTGSKGFFCTSTGYMDSLVSLKRFMSLNHECKYGEDDKQNDDQDVASKHKDKGRYVLSQVSRKGVRWSRSLNLVQASR